MKLSNRPAVLYLSHDGLTDPLGQSQILPYLRGLAANYSITIISCEKAERYRIHRAGIETTCRQAGISWEPLAYHRSPPVISTLYDLMRMRSKASRLNARQQFSIVHARSYPVALIALRMKKKYNLKFIFDMRGFWADERVEGSIWNLGNPLFLFIYRFFKRKEVRFVKNADHIISLTESAKREIISWQIGNAPITVIPTCVDLNLFNRANIQQSEQDTIRASLHISPADFVVIYLGSTSTWYRLDDAFSFFQALRKRSHGIVFLIVTKDFVPDAIRSTQGVVVTAAERKDVPLLLSLADLSICFIKPSFSKKASSATKMAESWAMQVPVVTNRGWGDVDALEKNFPILISDGSDHENDATASTALNYRGTSSRVDMSYFDLANGIRSLEVIYGDLLNMPNSGFQP